MIGVEPSKVKKVKTALESRSWIDKNRNIFNCSTADAAAVAAAAGGKLMGVPVTADAAAVLAAAAAGGDGASSLPPPLDEWLPGGAVHWLPGTVAPSRAKPLPLDDTPAAR